MEIWRGLSCKRSWKLVFVFCCFRSNSPFSDPCNRALSKTITRLVLGLFIPKICSTSLVPPSIGHNQSRGKERLALSWITIKPWVRLENLVNTVDIVIWDAYQPKNKWVSIPTKTRDPQHPTAIWWSLRLGLDTFCFVSMCSLDGKWWK